MANNLQVRELLDATAYDSNGDKLGNVKEVYINDSSGQPDFVEVNHGLFGMNSSLVPLRGHSLNDDALNLAFAKDSIKDSPNIDDDAHLSRDDQNAIYEHYGLTDTQNVTTYADEREQRGVEDRDAVNRDAAARREHNTADDDSLVRSEERLNVDKQRVNTGEAKLRKYVVHDSETVEVPVEREEVSVERTPIDPDDRVAGKGQKLGEDEASVTLHEDRVNVEKNSVPVEEVRLGKDTVRDTEAVTEDVAKERIEAEGTDGNKKKR